MAYPLLTDREKIMANMQMLACEAEGPDADRCAGTLAPVYADCNPEEQTITVEFEIKKCHINRAGILHGGMTSAFLDHVAGSVITAYDSIQCPTIDMTVRFFKPGREGDVISCVGKMISAGRKIFQIEVKMYNKATGELIAMSHSSYFNVRSQSE